MPPARRTHQIGSTQEEVDDFFLERGWSDGLPIVAPTPDRVARALEISGLEPDEIIGSVPVSGRELDVHTLAVNAVMAGCRGEHLGLIRAAMQAILDPRFNLGGVTATTHPAGPALVVSGAACDALGLNTGTGSLGPGNRAAATIGRAIRLILFTVGDALPGSGDNATHGSPAKFSYVIPENAAASPWPPLHQRSDVAGSSSVTCVAAEGPRNVNDHGSNTAGELVKTLAGTMATLGHNNLHRGGTIVVLLGPEHAAIIAREIDDVSHLQNALFDAARVPFTALSESNRERFRYSRPDRFDPGPGIDSVPVTTSARELLIAVSGGPGRHSVVIPSWDTSEAVTVGFA